ncbi:MAG TPA: HNH endonuclease signature motif containing protein [Candidatus Binatia bacterium]|jgi:5-methylcytosine-specific restriction endonuclease McrA
MDQPKIRVVDRAEWNARQHHRDPVFARDGWRCAVPGCSARRNLHDHHIVFRSHCGGNARDNRVAICAAHHQHGLHGGGYVRAWGEAPSAVHWALGVRRGASPLLTLIGDRYVGNG